MSKSKNVPTTTVHQSRLQLFQPTRRPKDIERIIQTPWGSATISGKIGQVHADIIEAMCRNAIDFRTTETGQLLLLVDPYQIRKSVGAGRPYSYDTLWKMIQELRKTSIEINASSGMERIMGGVLDNVAESKMHATGRNGEDRALWRVTLNSAFSQMLGDDLPLHYDPAPLAFIESGISQAIARHLLTHRDEPNGGWCLDKLIRAVGAGGTSVQIRNRRREVNKDAENLLRIGITVENGRVRLLRPTADEPATTESV